MKLVTATTVGGLVFVIAKVLFGVPEATVERLSAVMIRVTVQGRRYIVTRLGGGVYNVTQIDNLAALTFNQSGPVAEIGDAKTLDRLKSDIQHFPPSLFSEPA